MAAAWGRVKRSLELDDVDSGSFELLPLLYRTLADSGVEDAMLGRLKGVYRRTWYGNQLLIRRTGGAVEALRAEGVEAMVFGGAALGIRYYKHFGARAMADTAVAVPAAAARRAGELLGVGIPTAQLDDVLWAGRVPLALGDVAAYAPCAADELLRICAQAISGAGSCRWAADAVVLLRSQRDIDWDRLVARARRLGVTPHLRLTLAYVRETLDAPVAASVLDSLDAAARPLDYARLHLARGRAAVRSLRSA
ncbi:MAG: hypothetical protein QOE36_1641 [Gaiellaceae bacterium]|nr:hypothetical protein [Gaiellaceae bacterium]